MTKVAIITRTKDRSLLLARALQSVAQQTYTDYVHVIVNDGGNRDEVESVVDRQEADIASKIRLFHREVSSGAPDTIFTESIDRITSDYFVIHDDDDTWHPEFLARTVAHLDADQTIGGVVVRTDKVIELISQDSRDIKELKRTQYMPDLQAVSLYRQCLDNQLTPIATLFRRSAYEAVGKFDSSLPIVGDWEFGIRLLQQYDVDFLDPGFALAQYHFRKKKDNSFSIGHDHRTYVTKVANRYLRAELARGELGVGYIMSRLKYDEDVRHGLVKKFLPKQLVKVVRRKLQ